MSIKIEKNLEILLQSGKLNKEVILWGIGNQTTIISEWINKNCGKEKIYAIIDNFKYIFYKEYRSIPVIQSSSLMNVEVERFVVLLSIDDSEAIRKQLHSYGITEIYNLNNLAEETSIESCDIPYYFENRSKEKENLCYILAGYEPVLWDNTLQRVSEYADDEVDYCIVSSGRYDKRLEEFAKEKDWSYLYTEQNQVCFIQNKVIELHPRARYIIKLDEDIFIGKDFFSKMIHEFNKIEQCGQYRIGFAVPVIPLNCCGYVSYLELIGKKKEFETIFGRAYKSRFSAVFHIVETAEFLWDTMDSFDEMAEKFLINKQNNILDCYYNIGCIMFTRERWLTMGKWPEKNGESGMGQDEAYIYEDNVKKDMSIYEIQSVLAGHLAFGHQKKRMIQYFQEHQDKFRIANVGKNTAQ